MKSHRFLQLYVLGLFLLSTRGFADSNASYPPNLYETQGKSSPMVSASSAEASHWLALIDQAQYGAAWMDAGPLFQDIITQEQWIAAMRVLRRPLGNVVSRRLTDTRAIEVLPGGTRGAFMLIRYDTGFSAKSSATEIVTLMMIQNDQWRVISYSFK